MLSSRGPPLPSPARPLRLWPLAHLCLLPSHHWTLEVPPADTSFSGHASASSNPGTAAASSCECAHATSSSSRVSTSSTVVPCRFARYRNISLSDTAAPALAVRRAGSPPAARSPRHPQVPPRSQTAPQAASPPRSSPPASRAARGPSKPLQSPVLDLPFQFLERHPEQSCCGQQRERRARRKEDGRMLLRVVSSIAVTP